MEETLFDGPERAHEISACGPEPPAEIPETDLDVVMPLSLGPDRVLPQTPEEAADEIAALRTLRAAAEARELAVVVQLAEIAASHPPSALPGAPGMVELGGDGTPVVPEFVHLEVAGILGWSHTAARGLLADALCLRHRHPRLWAAVMNGDFPVWQARKIAVLGRFARLDRTKAMAVDRAIAPSLGKLSWPRMEALVEGEIAAADPEAARQREERARRDTYVRVQRAEAGVHGVRELYARLSTADAAHLDSMVGRLATALADRGDSRDLDRRRATALGLLATPERAVAILAGKGGGDDRLLPVTRLYVHVNADHLGSDGTARVEGHGPVPVAGLRALLADSRVRVTQVIDTRESVPVDAYETPERMREQVIVAQPYEVFPWSSRPSRGLDLDHTDPYRAGVTGQTRPGNLGPLSRGVHRAKTHAGWKVRQVRPGHWLWRSPLGRSYEVSNLGSSVWSPPPTPLEVVAISELSRPRPTSPPTRPRARPRRRRSRPAAGRSRSGRRPVGRRASRTHGPASLRRSS